MGATRNSRKLLSLLTISLSAALLLGLTSASGLTPPNPNEVVAKVEICHATGAEGKFVINEPNATGDVSGHAGASHQDGDDIIPPFKYSGGTFPGQNWDAAGQATYANDCVAVSATTPSTLAPQQLGQQVTPPTPGAASPAVVQPRLTG